MSTFSSTQSLRSKHRTATAALLLVVLVACTGEELAPPAPPPVPTGTPQVTAESHRDLISYLQQHNYSWSTLERGVPAFILADLPDDLAHIEEPSERKYLFFLSLLPMVLLVNEEITQEREELLTLFRKQDRNEPLTPQEQERIARIAADYKIDRDPVASRWVRERLLERIDIIPPSVVLAQAATESGYGTSRFAQLGNNLFGELTFERGTGLAPRFRQNSPFEARRFKTLQASLQSYVKNLNTNSAYRDLWRRRARMRAAGVTLRGAELAGALTAYSERGEDYVHDLRVIINANRLSLLSDIKLRPPPPQPPPRPIPALGLLLESTEK